MKPRKTVKVLGATPEEVMDESRRVTRTGLVALNVVPEWLASEPIYTASLAAHEARRLATQLLIAADNVEAQS
jgi:hypothetical protein